MASWSVDVDSAGRYSILSCFYMGLEIGEVRRLFGECRSMPYEDVGW